MSNVSLDGEIRGGRHHMPVRVYYEDTDFSGVVYHASYLRFMERGRSNYLRLLGTNQRALFEETEQEAPGFAFVVRRMEIDFRKPARVEDVLEVGNERKYDLYDLSIERAPPLVPRPWRAGIAGRLGPAGKAVGRGRR